MRIESERNPPALNNPTLVSFDVITDWKDTVRRAVKVYANARPVMCDGYRFEQGKEYVIYTHPMGPKGAAMERFAGSEPIYEVAYCPLRVLRDVPRAIRLLGPPRSPVKD